MPSSTSSADDGTGHVYRQHLWEELPAQPCPGCAVCRGVGYRFCRVCNLDGDLLPGRCPGPDWIRQLEALTEYRVFLTGTMLRCLGMLREAGLVTWTGPGDFRVVDPVGALDLLEREEELWRIQQAFKQLGLG